MELKIYNPVEDGFIKKIDWNYEDLKAEIETRTAEYAASVYNDDSIKNAKDDRQSLISLRMPWRGNGHRSGNRCWNLMRYSAQRSSL